MRHAFSILLILGLIIWGFLLWDRANPKQYTSEFEDAQVSDRCAEFRQEVPDADGEDSGVWSLGYEGRIRQLLHGCL